MAEVVHVGHSEYGGKLLPQSGSHLVLGGINAVLGKAPRFDIAIEDDHLMASHRDLSGREHSRGTGADHKHRLHYLPPGCRSRINSLSQPKGALRPFLPLAPALHLFIVVPDLEVELVDIVLREAGRLP